MSMSHQITKNDTNAALLEKVLIGNDFSGLSSIEKVQHIKNVCSTLGLNPLTKPIQLLRFQGKEVPYFTKDATEQLRKINKISLAIQETKILDGKIYMVIVNAKDPEGRTDSATGSVPIDGLKGDALSNAMLKAETKAKRRVTLSICGLGFMDESETDSIPNAQKIEIPMHKPLNTIIQEDDKNLSDWVDKISKADNLDELKKLFLESTRLQYVDQKEALDKIITAKDKRKDELQVVVDFNREIDEATGEVLS